MTRRIKLLLEYDGTHFAGWQRQEDQRTVQGLLEDALQHLTGQPHQLFVAGRTDAGVHASGQVAHFDTASALPLTNFETGLSHFGQSEVTVVEATEVSSQFHARFGATMRHYRYRVFNRRAASPLWRFYAHHVGRQLDVVAMQTALQNFHGELDCSSFRSSDCQSKTPMCFIARADVMAVDEHLIEFYFSANHFLHNMIRILAGTLLQIGLHELPVEQFDKIVAAKDRTQAGPTAPGCGLTFLKVDYPPEIA